MNKQKVTSSSSGGIGFFGLLTIVFITLKLMGYIDWDWVWVLAPMWGSCLAGILVFGIVIVLAVLFDR